MKYYFKIIPYFFLGFAVLFLFEAIMRINDGRDPWVCFLFTAVGIFMFFFKRKSYKRFEDRK